MKTIVIYDSYFGNTEKLAEDMALVLREYGDVKLLHADNVDPTILEEADLLLVGGPTQAHGLSPALKHLFENTPRIQDKVVWALAFDTRYDKPRWLTGSAAVSITHMLEKIGCRMLAEPESFFIEHQDGPLAEGELARAIAWSRSALAEIATPVAVA